MNQQPYKTLLGRGEAEFVVNKSRFIGQGAPCQSEEDALAFLKEIRGLRKDASHHCFAYIIGRNMGVMRYSDDGEPGGTAGMPIIEVMKAQAVTDCCVVVTRYFGGVLLGAGGLIRAYARGTSEALAAAGVGIMHPTARYLVDIPYPLFGTVEYHLKGEPVIIEDVLYADVVTLTFLVKLVDEQGLIERLVSLSNGALEPLRFDELYIAWPAGYER